MKVEVPPQPPAVAAQPQAPPTAPPAPLAVPPFACNDGHVFRIGAGHELCAHADAMSWEDAEARCVSSGGHLLAFEDENESKAVEAMLGSGMNRADAGRAAWLGLEVADKKKRTWKWSDGEAAKVTAWSAGEPNNWDGNEQCAEFLLASGKWNDTRCNLAQPYLCEAASPAPIRCSTVRIAAEKDYCWVPGPLDFANAKKACASLGGRLAMPKTAEAQTLLTKSVGQRFPVAAFWIGLNELADPGTWLWTTGAPLGDAHWKPEEPNGYLAREHCAEVFTESWEWNDLDCSEKLPSVCQSPRQVR